MFTPSKPILSRAVQSVAAASLLVASALALAQQAPKSPAQERSQFRKDNASAPVTPLPPELLAIAERVQIGRIPCELGHNVALVPDPAAPGYFLITTGKDRYRTQPVATTTGAIRLEDKARGGVWLQLANKSMLLDEKNGRRLADECMSPQQQQVAAAMKLKPPPSVIDLPVGASGITTKPDEPLPALAAGEPSVGSPATSSTSLNLSLPMR
jgi:hypothetical protein